MTSDNTFYGYLRVYLDLPTKIGDKEGNIYCTIVTYIKGRKWIKLTDKMRVK